MNTMIECEECGKHLPALYKLKDNELRIKVVPCSCKSRSTKRLEIIAKDLHMYGNEIFSALKNNVEVGK